MDERLSEMILKRRSSNSRSFYSDWRRQSKEMNLLNVANRATHSSMEARVQVLFPVFSAQDISKEGVPRDRHVSTRARKHRPSPFMYKSLVSASRIPTLGRALFMSRRSSATSRRHCSGSPHSPCRRCDNGAPRRWAPRVISRNEL